MTRLAGVGASAHSLGTLQDVVHQEAMNRHAFHRPICKGTLAHLLAVQEVLHDQALLDRHLILEGDKTKSS